MAHFRLVIKNDLGFEVWQDIPNYEGLYQASTYGRIKSVEKQRYTGKGGYCTEKEKIKSPLNNKKYYQLKLSKDDKNTMYLLHRIIAFTFLPKPIQGQTQINHIDENPHNNRVENLEWCTPKYNVNYGTAKERISQTRKSKNNNGVQQIKKGKVINTYSTCKEASEKLGICYNRICECARGEVKTFHGYEWKYV